MSLFDFWVEISPQHANYWGLQNDVHQIVKFQLLSSQPNADGKLGEALYSNGILAYP